MSSFKLFTPIVHLLEYFLPARNMATNATKGKINFNTKHLKKGDPMPPYNGKLRVYGMRYCPYAHRAMLALIAKGVDVEVVNISLVNKPEWYTEKSAFGKVPALEISDGKTIYESLVTVEYLDEIYPQRPLMSKDPVTRAYDKIIIEASYSLISTFFMRVLRNVEPITEESLASYYRGLEFIQSQLQKRGTKFLSGDHQPGYVDYMIWPWFERIQLADLDERIKIDKPQFKLLSEYIDRMFQDPVVTEYLVPKEVLDKFLVPFKAKIIDKDNINYELMNEV